MTETTTSNTTKPIPKHYGDTFSQGLGRTSYVGFGFLDLNNDSLASINSTGVGLDCGDVIGNGGSIGNLGYPRDYTFWQMNCYLVNSTTDAHLLLLDTVELNLTILTPNTYMFDLDANSSASVSQSYNWTLGDGSFTVSTPGEWIQHNYVNNASTSYIFNSTVSISAWSNATQKNSATYQGWIFVNNFVIQIQVPAGVTTDTRPTA